MYMIYLIKYVLKIEHFHLFTVLKNLWRNIDLDKFNIYDAEIIYLKKINQEFGFFHRIENRVYFVTVKNKTIP